MIQTGQISLTNFISILENGKSFWSEIKNIFPIFTSAHFYKNVADATFKAQCDRLVVFEVVGATQNC